MDVWECILLDVQAFAKYKDNRRYILSVMDVFTKFIRMIPMKTKSGPSVASVFRSIFDDHKYSKRRSIWVDIDKGKELLNKHFQDILREEGGIQFQVCRNPNLKCAVVEGLHRTIRDRHYKYFTHKNTYGYIEVLPKLSRPTITGFIRRLAWSPRE